MTKAVQQEIPGTETELSQTADDYLNAREAVDTAKADMSKAELKLIGAFAGLSKQSIKHRGYTLRLVMTPSKEKIQVQA